MKTIGWITVSCLVLMAYSKNNLSYGEEPEVIDEVELTWLAKNVYFEARNQGVAGQLAVAMVTLNRVDDWRFPNTIEGVVTQSLTRASWRTGKTVMLKNKCQFSWYCDGKAEKVPEADKDVFAIAQMIAFKVYHAQSHWDFTKGATHYHAYVMPDWAVTKTKTIEIADHIFYRWE